MPNRNSQAQSMFEEIYRTIRGGKAFAELTIAAIDSADPSRLRGMCIDPGAARDPFELLRKRDYWRGRLEECESILQFLDVCVAAPLGLSTEPLPARDLRIVVDNTKQEPRECGAQSATDDQLQETN